MVATPEQDPLSLTLRRQFSSLIKIFYEKVTPRNTPLLRLAKNSHPQQLLAQRLAGPCRTAQ